MAYLKNKTESVRLILKEKCGVDGFGKPIYIEKEKEIPGVLVETLDSQDVTGSTNLSGKRIEYKLHIPKGDTNVWENTFVYIRKQRCRTVGRAEEYINPPLDWNKTIKAEYYE